jgi:hypothetical protein
MFRIMSFVLLALITTEAFAQTIEQQTLAHIEHLRSVRTDADEQTTAAYNEGMDAAWTFFKTNNAAVLPILRRELSRELQKAQPNNLVLLDIGYYLRLQTELQDRELGKLALFKLDPTADIVYLNQQQLFNFAYAVAIDQDPTFLQFLDKAFLRQKRSAFVPQHSLSLNETLVCVFLYGVHGPDSEAHLRNLLKDQALTNKILEILIWIGTPDSTPDVKAAMLANRNFDTFARGTTFMMTIGGSQGRAVMLAINPKDFDATIQQYYERIRAQIEAVSFETLRKAFSSGDDVVPLGETDLRKRLSDMYASDGKDGRTDPRAILDSRLPSTFLIKELVQIRSRTLRRLSDEALSDVKAINAILNTLHYRTQ